MKQSFFLLNCMIIASATENELFERIIKKYDKSIRPQVDGSVTEISVYPTLFYLLTLNEAEQTIKFSIDFTFTWFDPVAAWDPVQYQYNSTLKIPELFIWQADLSITSSISRRDLIPYEKRMVQISHEGKVLKSGPQVIINPCRIQVREFPFDRQSCEFKIGPWSYMNTEVILKKLDEDFLPSSEFLGNSEWTFEKLSSRKNVEDFYEEGDYDELIFTVHLKRKNTFYVLAIIVPTFTCTTLCLFGFFLPSDISTFRTEKATLGISSLLAMSLILEMVTANMPKSSKLPLLGFFVLFEIILCAIAMIISCIYSILHQRATTRLWRPPKWAQKLFLYRGYDRKIRQQDACLQSNDREENSKLTSYIKVISYFIRNSLSDERLHEMWSRIFERLDVGTLILFQFINILATLIIII